MPRSHKRDNFLTEFLFRAGFFEDAASFVSLAQLRPGSAKRDPLYDEPHVFLAGKDMSAQRERVVKRDGYICRKCGRSIAWNLGEVHHVVSKGLGGSDDLDNLEWRCGRLVSDCHTSEHVRPQWSKKVSA